MTSTNTGLTAISLVCVPTPDQDKAVAFHDRVREADRPAVRRRLPVDRGLPARGHDQHRAGSAATAGWPGRADRYRHHTDHQHIDATHAAMKALGVDVDAQVSRMGEPVPPLFWFRDPTGHTLMVVES